MGRAGRKTQTEQTTRRCIATGAVLPCAGLIRFVRSPTGIVTPDIAGRLPGRGMWVSAERKALELAIKKNLFSRSAKAPVTVPDGLLTLIEQLVVKRLVELISLARKSGDAICGFEKTKGALMSGTATVLLQASDGSVPQIRKLRPPTGENTHISCLNAAELGIAFGRDYVIHAVLAGGGLTKTIRSEAARLAGIHGKFAIKTARTTDNPVVKG